MPAQQAAEVGRCRLKRVEPRLESAWCQLLKLRCDQLLSRFAFSFNLRPYLESVKSATDKVKDMFGMKKE